MKVSDSDVDLMDGLFAYDSGCKSSGIKDEESKKRFSSDAELTFAVANKLIRVYLLQDEYGLEDLKAFLDWIESELGFDI